MPNAIGLYEHVYVEPSFIEECRAELRKVVIRNAIGEKPNPLEVLAILVLKENALVELS